MEEKYFSKFITETIKHVEIAKSCKFGIVEIGVLNGETSKILAENSTVPVYGIDPIIRHPTLTNYIGDIEKIRANTSMCKNFIFIQDYSYNVVKTFDHDIDYLFIDGSHDYEDVKRDFNDWLCKVVPNGFISFHDSAMYRKGPEWWEGPSKFVDEILYDERLDYVDTLFSMTVFRKK